MGHYVVYGVLSYFLKNIFDIVFLFLYRTAIQYHHHRREPLACRHLEAAFRHHIESSQRERECADERLIKEKYIQPTDLRVVMLDQTDGINRNYCKFSFAFHDIFI